MPGMDGVELLQAIREAKLIPDTVVIILSNQGQQSDIDRAKVFGIQGYIVKATTIPSAILLGNAPRYSVPENKKYPASVISNPCTPTRTEESTGTRLSLRGAHEYA